jgi:hypothetical protein
MLPVVSGKLLSILVINMFRPHEFLVAEKDSEQASTEIPKNPQPGTSRDQVNIIPVTAMTFLLFLHFVRNVKRPILAQVHSK